MAKVLIVAGFLVIAMGCRKGSSFGEHCNTFRACAEGQCVLIKLSGQAPTRLCTTACTSDRECGTTGTCSYLAGQVAKSGTICLKRPTAHKAVGQGCSQSHLCSHRICYRKAMTDPAGYCSKPCTTNQDCSPTMSCSGLFSGIKVCAKSVSKR